MELDREKIIEGILGDLHRMRQRFMHRHLHKNRRSVTPAQGFVLHLVAKNEKINIKKIAEDLDITSSAATQLVDTLVENGYLIRAENPSDRRAIMLSLSEEASKTFTKFREGFLEKKKMIFSSLNDEELLEYARLNKKIMEKFLKIKKHE